MVFKFGRNQRRGLNFISRNNQKNQSKFFLIKKMERIRKTENSKIQRIWKMYKIKKIF